MATKSLLKNVEIKNKSMGKLFSDALEKADSCPAKVIELSRDSITLKGEAVKNFFKATKC